MITRQTEAGDSSLAGLPDVLQFMQLLWAVAHGLERSSKRMRREFGVTGPQRLVLRIAGLSPGLSAGRFAAILHVHPSTLTGILRRLVADGLLVRTVDRADRRRVTLRLTSRGERANALRGGTIEARVSAALADVSAADRRATRRVLALLARSLEPGRRSRTKELNR